MKFEKKEEFYSGKEYEYDLVDKPNVDDPAYIGEFKRLQAKASERDGKNYVGNYLPYEDSLALAKKFQPADPTNPRKPFAKELRLACAEVLGLETEEELDRIKIYTCLGGEQSPADRYHDVDFFISLESEDEQEEKITFQISKDPNTVTRADVFVRDDVPDPSDDNFDTNIVEIAGRYAREFKDSLELKRQVKKFKQPQGN